MPTLVGRQIRLLELPKFSDTDFIMMSTTSNSGPVSNYIPALFFFFLNAATQCILSHIQPGSLQSLANSTV